MTDSKNFKKICDRCGEEIPSNIDKKYVFTIYFKNGCVRKPFIYNHRSMDVDLCRECYTKVIDCITELGRTSDSVTEMLDLINSLENEKEN